MRVLVEVGEESAVFDVDAAHVRIVGIDSADPVTAAPRSIGDGALFEGFRRDALEQTHLGLQVIEIVDGEFNFATSLGATRLQRGASGENEDEIRAPGAESDPEAALETGAVGEQQHDGRNAPCHAEHGEDAATAIVLERAVGLAGEFANHSYSLLLTQGLHRLQQRGLARWIKSR